MSDLQQIHHDGLTQGLWSLVIAFLAWFLERIDAINGVLHFFGLVLSLVIGILALRKVLRK